MITPRARSGNVVPSHANLRIDVRLIEIPVTVTGSLGQPVTDLPRNAFRVFEDEVERPITVFSSVEMPISGAMVFDTSRSMKGRIGTARAAMEQFLKTGMPDDEFSLVRFSNTPQLLTPLTRDWDEISRQLSAVEPNGWTALFDAVFLATNEVRKGRNQRKLLVVLSDGADNNSRYSELELMAMLREVDVQVYAVSIFERSRSLERIAEQTGGRALWLRKLDDLPVVMETLSRQIRGAYLIGCIPGAVKNDGKYHRIRVEVQPPIGMENVRASWRHGYIATAE